MFAQEEALPGETACPDVGDMVGVPRRPGFACRLIHWPAAGFASSCTVVIMGFLMSRFPELFGRPVARSVFFSGPGFDLQKSALALLTCSTILTG
jgi:hypothetical protein